MGDVGLPLRGDCHVCRMGGCYRDGHGGDGGDDDGDDGDGCGDVDGGGGGNCKVIFIPAMHVTNWIPTFTELELP